MWLVTKCFACNWRKSLIHTCIFRFCQDVLSEDAMSRSLWSCSHAKIWRDVLSARNWRMSRNLTSFVCFSSNEMSWQLIYISLSTCCITWKSIHLNSDEMLCLLATDACFATYLFLSHAQILTRCLQWLVSRSLRSCLHAMWEYT